MSRISTIIIGEIRSALLYFVSMIPAAYAGAVVHTLSLEEAIKHDKHLGVFRRRKKIATLFRRH